MQKWEYLFLTTPSGFRDELEIKGNTSVVGGSRPIQDILNDLGEQGWEVTGSVSSSLTHIFSVILKRPKE